MESRAINIILVSVLVFLVHFDVAFTEDTNFALTMPGIRPTQDDDYLCLAKRLPPGRKYVVGYEPQASAQTVHHMLVYVCPLPYNVEGVYKCLSTPVCKSRSQIIFAWGLDAPSMHLPRDVGFKFDSDQFVVMQLHYTDRSLVAPEGDHSGVVMRMSSAKPLYLASILLFAATTELPPNKEEINVDVACSCAKDNPFGCGHPSNTVRHPFAFRTHAHDRATQISAYIIRDGKWILIGTQSPQRPQAFYPVPDPSITIQRDDILTARCSYNTTGQTRIIGFGSSRRDEMCNFYLMYYVSAKEASQSVFRECYRRATPAISRHFPHPPLPFFNGTEGHHHHHHHMEQQPVSTSAAAPTPAAPQLTMQRWTAQAGVAPGHLPDLELGQVGGVAVHPVTGHLYIFHRAARVWGVGSFNIENVFDSGQGPIAEATVVVVDPRTGGVVSSWGAGLFYMPHGIFVDGDGNIWLTDVALHQVFKFTPDDLTKPALVLGKRFIPYDDDNHFCKPADVVVDGQGFIYVSDGYCNHRIMKFSSAGQLVLKWDCRGTYHQPVMKLELEVPHALTMNAAGTRLCVADRENGRILCYKPSTGQLMTVNTPAEFGGRVFTIAFSDHPSGYLYAVKPATVNSPAQGFTLLPGTAVVLNRWYPEPSKHFTRPHTMAVAKDGTVYVGEIGPNLLWKFRDAAAIADPASPVAPAGHAFTSAPPTTTATTTQQVTVPTTRQPETSLPVAAETIEAATTPAPTTAAPTTTATTTTAPITTAQTTTALTTTVPTTSAPTTTATTTTAPMTTTQTTTAPITTTQTTIAPTTTVPTTTAQTTTAPTTTAQTTTAPTTTAPTTVGPPTTRAPTAAAGPSTTPATAVHVPRTAATTVSITAADSATADSATADSATADSASTGDSEHGHATLPTTSIWDIPVTSTEFLPTSAGSRPETQAIPRAPSRPIATGAQPASSHAGDDAGQLAGATVAATTNATDALGGGISVASTNIAVVFVLAFLCCTLLLVILAAAVRYAYRNQNRLGRRGSGRTPLRKLVSLTKHNGDARGVEFQKLQQECSDSDGF